MFVSVGVAHVNVPSASDLKNCVVVPLPTTFNSAAPTELSVIVAAFTVFKVANPPNPKFVLAVPAFVKSDKFWSFCNLPLTVVVKATTSESPFAIEAEISSNVSNAAPAPPIKSVISPCT